MHAGLEHEAPVTGLLRALRETRAAMAPPVGRRQFRGGRLTRLVGPV